MVSRNVRLSDIALSFAPEKQDIARFISIRWKNGIECPFCTRKNICEFRDGERFKCKDCEKIFSFKVGTPFEGSRLPLEKWFKAMRLLTQGNISGIKLAKELGVTGKTAWLMTAKLKNQNALYLKELI